MYIHLNIYEIILVPFSVFPLEHLVFFKCFVVVPYVSYSFFVKVFPQFYDQIKRKTGSSLCFPTVNKKPMGNLQIK